MHRSYQDAMAMCKTYGEPFLFLTMTCNPCWLETLRNYLPGHEPADRPDLVAEVCRLKLKELLLHINKRHVFRRVDGFCLVSRFTCSHRNSSCLFMLEDWDVKSISKQSSSKAWSTSLPYVTMGRQNGCQGRLRNDRHRCVLCNFRLKNLTSSLQSGQRFMAQRISKEVNCGAPCMVETGECRAKFSKRLRRDHSQWQRLSKVPKTGKRSLLGWAKMKSTTGELLPTIDTYSWSMIVKPT